MVEEFIEGDIYKREDLEYHTYVLAIPEVTEEGVLLSTMRLDPVTGQTSLPSEVFVSYDSHKSWSKIS